MCFVDHFETFAKNKDFYNDSLHPNKLGTAAIARALKTVWLDFIHKKNYNLSNSTNQFSFNHPHKRGFKPVDNHVLSSENFPLLQRSNYQKEKINQISYDHPFFASHSSNERDNRVDNSRDENRFNPSHFPLHDYAPYGTANMPNVESYTEQRSAKRSPNQPAYSMQHDFPAHSGQEQNQLYSQVHANRHDYVPFLERDRNQPSYPKNKNNINGARHNEISAQSFAQQLFELASTMLSQC